jgi:hypothetical protein
MHRELVEYEKIKKLAVHCVEVKKKHYFPRSRHCLEKARR